MLKPAAPARRPVAELRAGERVDDQVFLLTQKDLRTTTTGSLYIHAVLADQTGQLIARMWNASQTVYDSMPESGLLRIRGRVETYKGRPQLIIDGVRTVASDEVDPTEFLPRSKHDIEEMWSRLKSVLRTVENPDLLALLGAFLNDAAFAESFKRSPAARTNHHAFLGGLLEHTLNLLELAVLVLPRYPEVSRDLVLAGVFLHDAGKTAELACDTSFNYTNEGQLVGHIVQAAIWIHQRAAALEANSGKPFPREVLNALTHIIVAHHGQYEFGSPKLPATREAVFVHYLDNLDAKLTMMNAAIAGDPDATSDWTPWVQALGTRVFKKDVLGPSVRPAAAD